MKEIKRKIGTIFDAKSNNFKWKLLQKNYKAILLSSQLSIYSPHFISFHLI
jgi:hypothetical protein